MIDLASATYLKLKRIALLDISAASGIALRDDALYVIADDELHIGVYGLDGARRGRLALQAGVLPDDHVQRKASKPDFEALIVLPDSSLLVLGSGSTAHRTQGAWVRFDGAQPLVNPIDLSALFSTLSATLPELNIEGAAVLHDALFLSSRGNGARRENALIKLDLARVLEGLTRDRALTGAGLVDVVGVTLPELDGTALSLTDLTTVDERILFAAAAEASSNTFDDGACEGSALGILTPAGTVECIRRVEPLLKLEGVCAQSIEGGHRLWLVADADDRAVQAPLLQVDWAL